MKEVDNLTRDVLAAEAAGFGPWYGRYIAAYGHTSAPAPRRIQEKTAVCKRCGAEFILPDNMPRKYCGAECREAARQQQYLASKMKRMERTASACAALPE